MHTMNNSNVIKMSRNKSEFPKRTEGEQARYKKLHKTQRGQNAKGTFLNSKSDRDANSFEFRESYANLV